MRGVFITLEGPEGSGKTTHAAGLTGRFRELGYEVVCPREPGGTPTGEAIRDILQHDVAGEPISDRSEVFLFSASRAQLVRNVILPALERGACVVCDRFADSTTAYQAYGRGLDVETVLSINSFAIGTAVPDRTVLFDLDVKAGFERVSERNDRENRAHDRIEREEIQFHERVRAGYLDLAAKNPDRFRVINADAPESEVAEALWRAVQDLPGLQRPDDEGIL